MPTVATGLFVFLVGVFTSLDGSKRIRSKESKQHEETKKQAASGSGKELGLSKPSSITSTFRHYREMELRWVVAALKANRSILITGSGGSGKSGLGTAVAEQLSEEGFTIALIKPTTPKQTLIGIAEQLSINTQNLKGKVLTSEGLKRVIATFFKNNTAFLVIDDAHTCESGFRIWLKDLNHQGVPMLLLATNPPKSDVFASLPWFDLAPLPESALRELTEQAALERGDNLNLPKKECIGGSQIMRISNERWRSTFLYPPPQNRAEKTT